MKRVASAIALGLILAAAAPAADRLILAVGVSYMQPADPGYREIYGDKVFAPEAWAGFRLYKGLYAFAGYGWFTKKGTTPDLGLEARSTQRYLWAGLGYIGRVADMVQFKFEAGAASVGYKEESMGLAVSGSRLGFRAGAGLMFLTRTLFTGLDLGYLGASATVADVPIKLGGFKASICVGVRL
jgi:hypothetical protein